MSQMGSWRFVGGPGGLPCTPPEGVKSMYFLKPWVIEVQKLHRPQNSTIAEILEWGSTWGTYLACFEHFDVRYAKIEVERFQTVP